MVRLRGGHQVEAAHGLHGMVADELGRVAQGQQHAPRRPRELVAERVRRSLGRRQTAAERAERLHLAAGLVDVGDGLDGVQVVETGVEADLVHDRDAGSLDLGLQGADGVRHIRRRDDVDLVLACRADHSCMVRVRDERDDEVVRLDRGAEGLCVLHVDLHGACLRELGAELGGVAGRADGDAELREAQEVLDDRRGDVARAEHEHALGLGGIGAAALDVARRDDGGGRRLAVHNDAVRKLREDKGGAVDVVVVVGAVGHGAQGLADVALRVERAHDEADLAAWVRRDHGVGVVGDGEQLLGRLGQRANELEMEPHALGLRRDVAAGAEGALEQLKVWLLEEHFGGAVGVGGVGDDDVERALVLRVLEERKAVADDHARLGVRQALGHARQVLLRHTRHGLVNVTQHGLLDHVVLHNLTEHTAIATANHKHAARVRVRVDRQVRNHLLVRKLVSLRALDRTVEHEDVPVRLRLEHKHVLEQTLFVVQDAAHAQAHRLPGPLRALFAEPAIADQGMRQNHVARHGG